MLKEKWIADLFIVALLLCGVTSPAIAQGTERLTTPKWRPRDGTYVGSGHNYNRCSDFGDLIVELRESSIGDSEWTCKIKKISDVASDSIRLDTSCALTHGRPSQAIPRLLSPEEGGGRRDPHQLVV